MLNKFLRIFLLVGAFVFAANALAATENPSPDFKPDNTNYNLRPEDAMPASFVPKTVKSGPDITSSIFVGEITLDKKTYKAGDTVSGKISLENKGSADQTDIHIDVSLVGDYSTKQGRYGIPETFYKTETFGPFSIKAKDISKVSFSFVLPKNVGGDGLGIEVSAHSVSGVPYGWSDFKLDTILGASNNPMTVTDAYVKVDGIKYSNSSGPTLGATSTATFSLVVKNNSKDEMVVTPEIVVNDKSISGKLIKKYSEKEVSVKASATKEFVFEPFRNNNIPGVYLASVSLKDKTGNTIATPVTFRYIVPGDIATIHEVTPDQTTLEQGVLTVNVLYSGPPQDIATGKVPTINGAILNVKIVDEKNGSVLGESTTPATFSGESDKQILPIGIKSSKDSVKIFATIELNGKVLSSYESSSITLDMEKIKKVNSIDSKDLICLSAITAIFLIIVFYLLHTRYSKRFILFLIILLSIISGLIIYNQYAKAATLYYGLYSRCTYPPPGYPLAGCIWSGGSDTSSMSVFQPTGTSFATGDTIPVQGAIYSFNCFNTPNYVDVTVYIANSANTQKVSGDYTYSWRWQNCAGNENCGYGTNTSSFGFNVPQNLAPGNYNIIIHTMDAWRDNPQWANYSDEYYQIPITIGSSPKGTHDTASCTVAEGWTCDADNYNEALRVDLYDGPYAGSGANLLGNTTANVTRESAVGAQCGGNVNHGFSFTIPNSIKDGQNHSIYAYAINASTTGSNILLSGSPKTVNCTLSIPAPVVTGPDTGVINTNYTFTAVSTYSANNGSGLASNKNQTASALLAVATVPLKYGFDWNKDGTVDEWQPSSGYVNSGTSVSASSSWSSTGAKNFQVKAQDGSGNVSAWTPFTITINDNTCSNGATDYPTCTPLSTITDGANNIFAYARCSYVGAATSTISINWSPSTLTNPTYEVYRGSSKIDSLSTLTSGDQDQPLGQTLSYFVHTLANEKSGTSPTISVTTPSSCSVSAPPSDTEATVKTFASTPPLGNPPFTCTLNWELNSYRSDGSSVCTIEGPRGFSTTFIPVNKLGSAKVYNVMSESQYAMYCEGSGATPLKKYATCRLNPNYVER